jgi:hypothetical protein
MCRENGSYTSIAARLLDANEWLSHGKVIGADGPSGWALPSSIFGYD